VDFAPETPGRRPLLVSKWWLQAVVLVFLFGFFVLGLLAYRTYTAEPPIPDRVVASDGLGSYGSLGLEYKKRLLALEGVAV